jgi:hypothetical protein
MAGGQDSRATSELFLNDMPEPAEILAIVRRSWQGHRRVDVNVGRLGMMKDPWPLRILSYVSRRFTPGHSIMAGLGPITCTST